MLPENRDSKAFEISQRFFLREQSFGSAQLKKFISNKYTMTFAHKFRKSVANVSYFSESKSFPFLIEHPLFCTFSMGSIKNYFVKNICNIKTRFNSIGEISQWNYNYLWNYQFAWIFIYSFFANENNLFSPGSWSDNPHSKLCNLINSEILQSEMESRARKFLLAINCFLGHTRWSLALESTLSVIKSVLDELYLCKYTSLSNCLCSFVKPKRPKIQSVATATHIMDTHITSIIINLKKKKTNFLNRKKACNTPKQCSFI